MNKRKDSQKYAALNRRARFDYAIEEKIEAGIMLTGTEVKSLRAGRVSIAEAYAAPKEGEIYLINADFALYGQAGKHLQHEPKRMRKLLLRARQRAKLIGTVP